MDKEYSRKPVRDRAIAAYLKAHPSAPHRVRVFKTREAQTIKVRGYESKDPSNRHCVEAVWSYANSGLLKRIS